MIKNPTIAIEDILSQLRLYLLKKSFSRQDVVDKPPFRSEIFTYEQMSLHANQLAQHHLLSFADVPEQLLKRLSEDEEMLTKVAELLQDAVKEKKRISPAGDWLLDNFYLIKEQIDIGKKYLPKGYSKGLPKLTNKNAAGLPRVFDIALQIISHSDGHIDIQNLCNFIKSYQEHSQLTIGELWAVPIMLRLALLENLTRVSAQMGVDQIDENLAIQWAEKLEKIAENDPKNLIMVLADMARSKPPMISSFVIPFIQKFQWKGAEMSIVISWVEHQLSEKNTSISSMMQNENQKQAADQVSMSNSINSLRFLAKTDWRDFVEEMSVTDTLLRTDPSGVYGKMDFNTRDMYRHAVEKISKKFTITEEKVAKIAVDLATNAGVEDNERNRHVGFYLIGKGKWILVNAVKNTLKGKPGRIKSKVKVYSFFYTLTVITISALLVIFLLHKIYNSGIEAWWVLVIMGVVVLICSSQFALQIGNWLGTIIVKPQHLPRMDFSKGIPEDSTTLVVVPSMLSNESEIATMVEELEVRFLANRTPHLYFALLTDFSDARQENMPEDDALLHLVERGIQDLNSKYFENANGCFYLFHRKRTWNPHEKRWMGWERKRGKLEDLNNLLRGNRTQRFISIVGNEQIFSSIKYVLTLDSDTKLPREAACKLAGIMAHPLNKPVIDRKKNMVIDGYGIIQPRIAMSLHATERSRYTVMHENDSGIDPYTKVTSNLYQDIFNEGSYIGKGMYDLDVFEKVLGNRFPENKILSHDLLEGSYVRCAFASDVQLFEIYPSRYRIDMKRRHRWIRGDWQIMMWLFPWVLNNENKWIPNPVNGLAKWKIFDNLRRSLVPVALMVLLLFGWTVLGSPLFWTLIAIGIGLVPSVIASAWDIIRKPAEIKMAQHFRNSAEAIFRTISEAVLYLICLPYEAFISLDAIFRSIWRMLISKQHLLKWTPYENERSSQAKNLIGVFKAMWPSALIVILALIYMGFIHPLSIVLTSPFLIAWTLSPVIVWWFGFPLTDKLEKLSAKQITLLRKLSRRIWLFYENFVGPEDNWLPPDNFQQQPTTVLAHRTSPTNMGLTLLANLSACDFGYISLNTLIERSSNTLTVMQKLERHSGHFYNWYNTQSLQPLYPRYISVVDSGNLGAHLLVLKQGLLSLANEPIFSYKNFEGFRDVLQIMMESVSDQTKNSIKILVRNLKSLADQPGDSVYSFKKNVDVFASQYKSTIAGISDDEKKIVAYWNDALNKQIVDVQQNLLHYIPWADELNEESGIQKIPSLFELIGLEESNINNVHFKTAASRAQETVRSLQTLVTKCDDLANMEFGFLYDHTQHLFVIGFNVEEHKPDAACYDLLASEARLASFLAISQDKVPQENWFALGRRLTNAGGNSVLLSWSGSMFEYLMPNLVMPVYENTLLEHSNQGSVRKQIEYGRRIGAPWGISESCYNVVDAHLNYQYKAFGVPGLGLKRGLGEDLVIAPYATIMALMVEPVSACENIEVMIEKGYQGKYGLFEAVDFTASRLPRNQSSVIIQTFMVHHLGMSLLSLAYALLDKPMQKRFESEPMFQATLLLLQEQIPKISNFYFNVPESAADVAIKSAIPEMRIMKTPHTSVPEVQLLSNGRYHVMMTNSGGGYSRWKDKLVTRWREDSTCDNWGTFCYIKDLESQLLWSNTYHPTLKDGKIYEAIFTQGRAEYKRLDNGIETHTDVIVSPEDDVEIRRITLTNRSNKIRKIEITSYAEVVLNFADADSSHPAFGNLFIQTEIIESYNAIISTRRPVSADEDTPGMFHLIKTKDFKKCVITYETDRNLFIGRGNTIIAPAALKVDKLSNTQGPVLDPIVAIRYCFELESDETFVFDMLTGVAESKDDCLQLIEKYQDRQMRDRAFELSWTHSQVILRQINATEADANLFGKMTGSVLYSNPHLRAEQSVLVKNRKGQSSLWGYSISGDLPIVLLHISSTDNIMLVKQMIQARAYWQLKGVYVDLFIWNEDEGGYRNELQDQIQKIISTSASFHTNEKQGGVFVRPADQISPEDKILLHAVARVIISDKNGSLADQLKTRKPSVNKIPYLSISTAPQNTEVAKLELPPLEFFNGMGGFTPEGHEYIIKTGALETPAPWVNVFANKKMGCVVSERGSSYTWYQNAHEYRLTPWSNDPVSDGGGEAFYIRDESSGMFWSPAAFAAKGNKEYITKHGFGYSVFEYREAGIISDMEIFVDTEDAIKFFIINLNNASGKDRKLSLTGYIEWVLGNILSNTGMHIITEFDLATGAIYAYNPYNTEFEGRVCFFYCNEGIKSFTASRREFIGRNGSLRNPDAMKRTHLSGKIGAGFDSCAALQYSFDLANGQTKQLIFKLGAAQNMQEARLMVQKFRLSESAHQSLAKVHQHWEIQLHNITVSTPRKDFDFLLNGWLLYQTISCRIWGRSGFYQSGGAFGFRDQLQDTMAALYSNPQITKEQLLLCASRQFKEGDVQHWWHPPQGRGVRTHCSDDYLWLPFVLSKYIQFTGDTGILDEQVGFLEGRLVKQNEESYYDLPNISAEKATLYQHSKLAVQHGFRYGMHGFPLMGCGDWNDGMNLVGKDGKGESVWLSFFLYDVLQKFLEVAKIKNDTEFVQECEKQSAFLKDNIQKHAWDGNWFIRAFFDDGTPLGSAQNEECKIDSISQSWSVLSEAANPQYSKQAMASVEEKLVYKMGDTGLIKLLSPPFDKSPTNPGYIKGYLPGVRENGGQYTHAAVWAIMAFAKLKNVDSAWELLQMISPVNHTKTPENVAIYKVEPYVMAADVYAMPPHTGRGGWTWYTGSAGWYYQLMLETFIGFKLKVDELSFEPCLPKDWNEININYRYKTSTYQVLLKRGDVSKNQLLKLVDDGKEHAVTVYFN